MWISNNNINVLTVAWIYFLVRCNFLSSSPQAHCNTFCPCLKRCLPKYNPLPLTCTHCKYLYTQNLFFIHLCFFFFAPAQTQTPALPLWIGGPWLSLLKSSFLIENEALVLTLLCLPHWLSTNGNISPHLVSIIWIQGRARPSRYIRLVHLIDLCWLVMT